MIPISRKAGDNMRVETIVRFRDLKAGKIREIGDSFTVSTERGSQLIHLGYVKEQEDEPEEEKSLGDEG